jgi:hypothetical protein
MEVKVFKWYRNATGCWNTIYEEVLYGLLLQGNECSDISESDCSSDSMNMKIWLSSKQGVNTDDEVVFSNGHDMKHHTGITFGMSHHIFHTEVGLAYMLIYKIPVTHWNILSC